MNAAGVTPTQSVGPPPKTLDNRPVQDILEHFVDRGDLTGAYAAIESIIIGASLLKTAGDGATRPLVKADLLFRLLRALPIISTEAVRPFLGPATADRTAQCYAAAARVASRGIAGLAQAQTLTPAQRQAWGAALGPKAIDDPLGHLTAAPVGSGYCVLKDIPRGPVRQWDRSRRLAGLSS